jgi:hypothetical protein
MISTTFPAAFSVVKGLPERWFRILANPIIHPGQRFAFDHSDRSRVDVLVRNVTPILQRRHSTRISWVQSLGVLLFGCVGYAATFANGFGENFFAEIVVR